MIATKLGPYEITGKLGEGGMGEVYRATDSRLKRDVAIKVLPAAFLADPERLARFEREAQLLAQLHHPNIASIYGVEESDGVRALVMELVDGPTLADRLEHGRLAVDESLTIARQIAAALEDAHERGIVHRDLKPQNIKAAIGGEVKVLDFGLAKAMDATNGGSDPALSPAASPTFTQRATLQGVILGTAAYMAPEQAKGFPVDKRADIWAFGVVLYEMLTGQRMFRGDSVPDTLAGVLKSEIDLSALPPETPAAIRGLLRRCLERSPKNRLRDIGDARLAIDEVLAGGTAGGASASAAAPLAQPSIARFAPWAILLLVLGAGAGWLVSRVAAPVFEAKQVFTLRRLTELPGLEGQPDLSPDGRQVVYSSAASGNLDIFVMRTDGGRAINITAGSSSDDEQAAFSPDGQRLVFRSSRDGGGLFVMGATGESVRRLTDGGFNPSWSPDGTKIAYSLEPVLDPYARDRDASLWIVDVASGEKRQRLPGDAVQPAWSPDGRRIAYWSNTSGQRDLWTVGVDSGDPVAVTADEATDWSPEWSPDGRWLYFSSDRAGSMNLFRVAIDPATGGAAGAPEQMTTSVGNLGWFRFSADGRRLVAAAYERSAELHLNRLTTGAAAALEPLRTLHPRFLQWCKLSPDAEWLACSTIGTPEDVVLLRADGSEVRRLTDDRFKDRNISWSRDGSRLVFDSTRNGGWDVWTVRADGSELRRAADTPDTAGSVWSTDGQRLTFVVIDRGYAEVDAGRFTAGDAIRYVPLPDAVVGFEPGEWSPSGEFLGGTEVDVNRRPLSIGALDPKTRTYRRSQLPIGGGVWSDAYWKFAGWLPDSKSYVASGRDQIALIDVQTGAWRGLQAVDRRRLLVSLSRDGRTLLVEQESFDGDLWMLEVPGGGR